MLFDKEGHLIKLADKPNPHILSIGNSGYGKTFFACRKIEEDVADGKRGLIIDYSGSFRETELKKNGLKLDGMQIFNPFVNPFYFMCYVEDERKFVKDIADSLVNIWKISSYNQKTILEQTITEIVAEYGYLNFSLLFKNLKIAFESEKSEKKGKERIENIGRLLMRMDVYADISHIRIKRSTVPMRKKRSNLQILQLSDFPEQQRHFLSEFFITMIWKEVIGSGESRYNVIYLDEFQHLPMVKSGALSSILREGRKYGLALVLSTQFISRYTPEEQDALMQCGNILFFKPTARENRLCAELINKEKKIEWEKIFGNLEIGEVVLKGNFILENHSKILTCPLLCEVH